MNCLWRFWLATFVMGFVVFGIVGSIGVAKAADTEVDAYSGREILIHMPADVAPAGRRALVIVLHGGLGNAQRIVSGQSESALNINAVADKAGFVVAYMNGTPVTRRMGDDKLGWDAGDCCGLSSERRIDDVGYIHGAIDYLSTKYGIDKKRVFGVGHSNGAMMLQRLMCETNLLAAALPISGPLEIAVETCPAAKGARILAIHGRDDQNVPIAGGRGQGLSQTNYASEEHTRQVFTRSGADYDLEIIAGADHKLDHIESAILADRKQSIAQIAAEFFGLVGFSTSAFAQNQNQRGACKADYEKYCSGVSPGGGRIVECLNKQYDSLSEACKAKLDARTKQ